VAVHLHSCGLGLMSTFPGWLCVVFSIFVRGRNELELKLVIVCNDALFFALHAVISSLSLSLSPLCGRTRIHVYVHISVHAPIFHVSLCSNQNIIYRKSEVFLFFATKEKKLFLHVS
jgi:hypothetical protein